MDLQTEIELYTEIVKENIDYESLSTRKFGADILENIVSIMVSVLTSKRKTICVGKEELPIDIVKSRFLKLNMAHIECAQTVKG